MGSDFTTGPFILKDPCPHCGHTTRDDAVIKRLGEQINQTIAIPAAEYEGLRKLRDFLPIILDAMEFAEVQFKDTLSDPMDALEGQDALDRYNNVALARAAIKEQEG